MVGVETRRRGVHLQHHAAPRLEHGVDQQHEIVDEPSPRRIIERGAVRIQTSGGAHQLVDDREVVCLQRRTGCGVVDDHVGVFGRKHFGRTIRANKLGAETARADPAAREPLVLRRDDQATLGQLPAFEQRDGSGCDELHGIEPGVEQLDDVRPTLELRHPVRAGETDVAAAQGEHLHDVLGFQHFCFGARQRHVGAIAPRAGAHANARVGEEGQHALLHPAFGKAETEGDRAWYECGHRSTPFVGRTGVPQVTTPPKKHDAGPGGPASVMIQDSTRLRLSPVDRVTVVMPVRRSTLH